MSVEIQDERIVQPAVDDMTDAEMDKMLKEQHDAEEAEAPIVDDEDKPESAPAKMSEKELNQLESSDKKPNVEDLERYKKMADEERIRRKEIQKSIENLQRENEQLKNTFNKILEKATEQSQQVAQSQIPDENEDPIEYLKYQNKQLSQRVENAENFSKQITEQQELTNKQRQFFQAYKEQTDQFERENPEFKAAYDFAIQEKYKEYIAMGYDKERAANLVYQDELNIAASAMSNNENPGKYIYEFAKFRGFSKAPSNDKNPTGFNTDANKAAADAKAKIAENEKKLEAMEKGLEASKSVNNLSSSNVHSRMTVEQAVLLSDEDFSKVNWDELMKIG